MKRAEREDRLEAVIRATASDLLAYLERRIDPRADAADVLSEALIVAWKKASRLPSDDVAARMWLFAITRNTLLNARRATSRRNDATSRLRVELSLVSAADDPDNVLAVRDAVNNLPLEMRELVELVHWEGFSIAEAASITSVSPSTARSRYSAAKAKLRRALTTEVENSPT
ncbi:RNA polymerase sigma factor [Leifsonia sp. Leaf264]|uniref:RNA polymerase sigma factor n=1 Tax=Leifsonia sp. Leaf264 TaxID=1736314 RepID=UPI00070223CA|nr:sigma-70 family RNA polymerase sigma factor [Leifsonia sp. Leaf264]KQP01871.1 hypothetical protein ASF30_04745 [Leifsonia sp. Leaf264]